MLNQLKPGVFEVPGFLAPSECRDLIQCSEAAGFSAADVRTDAGSAPMPKIRNNDRLILGSDDVFVAAWVALLAGRLLALNLPDIAGERAVGLPQDLRFYRYGAGQRFKMHKDGPWREDGLTSRLTFLVYLNEGFTGGETDFRDLIVTPKTGSALIFEHATWHEGAAVTGGTKYVLRSDVMYAPATRLGT